MESQVMLKLQLDANAVSTLFPAGSEMFLHLQQSVLQETTKRALKGLSQAEIQDLVRENSKKVSAEVNKELKEIYKESYGGWNADVSLSSRAKDEIRKEVNEAFRDTIVQKIAEIKSYYETDASKAFKAMVSKCIEEEIWKQISESGFLKEQLSLIIKEKLKGVLG
jgi:hypothetical protein